MNTMKINLTLHPGISAVYYGLLQSGYDYYPIERSPEHIEAIRHLIDAKPDAAFFAGARQNTCEPYAYWPRAFILEAAALSLKNDYSGYQDFDAFQSRIMAAPNISDSERDDSLWDWLVAFPAELARVMESDGFARCLAWEKEWIAGQKGANREELRKIETRLGTCAERYGLEVDEIQIHIDPIKCVYASDHHRDGDSFLFTSGTLRADSVIHECLHLVVHPEVERQRGKILRNDHRNEDVKWQNTFSEKEMIDQSYFLSGDETGILNAFEETAVRALTDRIMKGDYPSDLPGFLELQLQLITGR